MNKRIIFMGTPEFSATILAALHREGFNVVACFSQPDKPTGRHMTLTAPPAKVMAESLGIPVFQPSSLRNQEALDMIEGLRPDLIVTAAYGKILPEAILSIPPLGCLNVHASLLPRYRGAAPIQWAIMNGDTVTGVTLMRMDVGMDTGDMISRSEVCIPPRAHYSDLVRSLADCGAKLLTDTLPLWIRGEIPPERQDDSLATYSPPIRKEQGNIDWNRSARSICNQIRALSDWPGAYTYQRGDRIKIYDAVVPTDAEERVIRYRNEHGEVLPGTLIEATKTELFVACGEGCLQLLSVQPASCKKLNVRECAHNFQAGIRFDGAQS